jgi:hypothetical protein
MLITVPCVDNLKINEIALTFVNRIKADRRGG